MKVSLAWLREFVDLPASVAELVDLLTLAGVEVEEIIQRGADLPHVVIGQIVESTQHPNADRLSVCRVDIGTGELQQIVCGAKNYRVQDKVPVALPGAVLPGDFKIKVGKLRGVESHGMLCSSRELGLGQGEDGLLILPPSAPVGQPLSVLYPADVVLDLEITPNRPDLLSHFGIAREIAALRQAPLKSGPPAAPAFGTASARLALAAPALCPFYSARRIQGVKVGPSPEWLRTRLETVGLRSINNIVDVTNYVMMELGQPLHAFDEAQLQGSGIHVRPANPGETFLALDGKSYALLADDLVIADAAAPVAIAGVMGGEHSGVTAATTDVLLESALFSPQSVRRTSRRLGLLSDSSYRFERGIDPGMVLAASARAVELILLVAGGTPSDLETAGSLPLNQRHVTLRPGAVEALLGVAVPEARIHAILSAFGLHPEDAGQWRIPTFRQDITREADLIEEVTRAFGIENIPGAISGRPVPASPADACHDLLMGIRRRLAGCGFSEARNFSLVSEQLAAQAAGVETLRIRNPLLEDQVVLRPELLPGLLTALQRNLRAGARTIRLFEIGRVFRHGAERTHLAALLTGPVQPHTWRGGEARPADLFDLKGQLAALGLNGLELLPADLPGLLPAQDIRLQGAAIGVLGQLTPARLRELDLQQPVSVFELDLDACKFASVPEKIAPLPRFPIVTRDIAMVVIDSVSHAQIEAELHAAREPLLARVELFDLFSDPTGQRVPTGSKSLAYSLTYRSDERTLTADEVNAAHTRLKERLKAALPVHFRE